MVRVRLAVFIWATRGIAQVEAVHAAAIQGYALVRPLGAAEMSALFGLVAARHILMTGKIISYTHAGVATGYQIDAPFLDQRLAWMETWLAQHGL